MRNGRGILPPVLLSEAETGMSGSRPPCSFLVDSVGNMGLTLNAGFFIDQSFGFEITEVEKDE
jgi:hypothetical protein